MTTRAALLVLAGVAAATGCAGKPAVVLPPARLLDRGAGQSVDPKARETPVTVRVEDEGGATVAGAQVVVVAGWSYVIDMPFGGHGSVGEDGIADGPSDSAGLFVARPRLSTNVKYLRAAALHDGLAGTTERKFERDGDGGAALVVVLRPGVTYTGRVVDSAGKPVPDAKVQCHFGDGDFDLECGVAGDGAFRCGPVPAGTEKTWISAVHHGPLREVWSEGETHPTTDRPIVLVVDPVPDTPENRK
jgi:hypothetical protein